MVSSRPMDEAKTLLRSATAALKRGDRAESRRLAREAIELSPAWEIPWLYLAAASDPEEGLTYVARALEINPKSRSARKAVRWMVRRLPKDSRRRVISEVQLPEDQKLRLMPLEALTRRRLLSLRLIAPALVVAIGIGIWLGYQPADAQQPQSISAPLPKATWTPTPTNTPTSTPTPTYTPTPTPTSTPTNTPTPTITYTPRPRVSFDYSLDPLELAGEGRWIDVDLGNQRVTAYSGATPVKSFYVSTGIARYPTVTGTFRIWVKLLRTDMAGPGYYLPGVPYTMYFYRSYALHGTYWHSNFGTPMSHGCVNLETDDAKWLYSFAKVGTLVNVHP